MKILSDLTASCFHHYTDTLQLKLALAEKEKATWKDLNTKEYN